MIVGSVRRARRASTDCGIMHSLNSIVLALFVPLMFLGTRAYCATDDEPMPDWALVLGGADLEEGHRQAYKCMQCHDVTEGRQNRFGPPLWGVVGRARATARGFAYSQAMRATHDVWTFDRLFRYLKSPQGYVPGTPMSFSGIRSAKYRIDLIAWLRTQSDRPLPLPDPVRK